MGFQDRLSLNAGQVYCRMLSWSILQYFRPSLTSTICLRPLFCLFFEWSLKTGFTVMEIYSLISYLRQSKPQALEALLIDSVILEEVSQYIRVVT